MSTAQEIIREALRDAENADVGIQPCILMNESIDHSQVEAYQTSHVNDSWADTLNGHLVNGFKVFRIQTEFGINGHYTMAYLAKMKTN